MLSRLVGKQESTKLGKLNKESLEAIQDLKSDVALITVTSTSDVNMQHWQRIHSCFKNFIDNVHSNFCDAKWLFF